MIGERGGIFPFSCNQGAALRHPLILNAEWAVRPILGMGGVGRVPNRLPYDFEEKSQLGAMSLDCIT